MDKAGRIDMYKIKRLMFSANFQLTASLASHTTATIGGQDTSCGYRRTKVNAFSLLPPLHLSNPTLLKKLCLPLFICSRTKYLISLFQSSCGGKLPGTKSQTKCKILFDKVLFVVVSHPKSTTIELSNYSFVFSPSHHIYLTLTPVLHIYLY